MEGLDLQDLQEGANYSKCGLSKFHKREILFKACLQANTILASVCVCVCVCVCVRSCT